MSHSSLCVLLWTLFFALHTTTHAYTYSVAEMAYAQKALASKFLYGMGQTGMLDAAHVSNKSLIMFLPSDVALNILPVNLMQQVKSNPDTVQQLLLNHVAFEDGQGALISAAGDTLRMDGQGRVNGVASVVKASPKASNGRAFVLDNLLVPTAWQTAGGFPTDAFSQVPSRADRSVLAQLANAVQTNARANLAAKLQQQQNPVKTVQKQTTQQKPAQTQPQHRTQAQQTTQPQQPAARPPQPVGAQQMLLQQQAARAKSTTPTTPQQPKFPVSTVENVAGGVVGTAGYVAAQESKVPVQPVYLSEAVPAVAGVATQSFIQAAGDTIAADNTTVVGTLEDFKTAAGQDKQNLGTAVDSLPGVNNITSDTKSRVQDEVAIAQGINDNKDIIWGNSSQAVKTAYNNVSDNWDAQQRHENLNANRQNFFQQAIAIRRDSKGAYPSVGDVTKNVTSWNSNFKDALKTASVLYLPPENYAEQKAQTAEEVKQAAAEGFQQGYDGTYVNPYTQPQGGADGDDDGDDPDNDQPSDANGPLCGFNFYCDVHAYCQLPTTRCICRSGWEGYGTVGTCTRETTCAQCSPSAMCLRNAIVQMYYCQCMPGFFGNGFTCTPVGPIGLPATASIGYSALPTTETYTNTNTENVYGKNTGAGVVAGDPVAAAVFGGLANAGKAQTNTPTQPKRNLLNQ